MEASPHFDIYLIFQESDVMPKVETLRFFPEASDSVVAYEIRKRFEDRLLPSSVRSLADFFLTLASLAAEVFSARLVTVWDSNPLSNALVLQASWPERQPTQGTFAVAADKSLTGLAVSSDENIIHEDLSQSAGEIQFANPHIVDAYHLSKMVSILVKDLFDEERTLLVLNLCYSSDQHPVSPLTLSEMERLARFWSQSLLSLTSILDESLRESVERITPSAAGISALFDSLLPVLQAVTRATFGEVYLWNHSESRLEVERSNRPDTGESPALAAFAEVCLGQKSPFLLREEIASAGGVGVRCRVMAVPILSTQSEGLGVIACYEPQADGPVPLSFSSLDLRVLIKFSSLIAPSIERFARLRRGSRLDQAVKQIAASIASKFESLDVLQRSIETIVQLTNAEVGSIYLLEDSVLVMRAGVGANRHLINEASYHIGEGLTGSIAEGAEGRILTFKNRAELVASPFYRGKYDELIWVRTSQGQCENFLGVPIRLRGQILGIMKVANKKPSEDDPTPYFTEEDVQLAAVISSFLGYAIESARQEEKKVKTFRTLAQSTISIESARSVDDAISTVMSDLEESGYQNALLALVNKNKNILEGTISLGRKWQKLEASVRYPLGSAGLLVEVLRQNRSEFIPDSRVDPRCDPTLMGSGDVISQYIMPLRLGEELIGTLQVDLGKRQVLPEDIRLILQAFAGHLAIAISRIRSIDALLEMTNQVMSGSRFIVAETLSSMAVHSVHHRIRKIMADLRRDLGRKEVRERELLITTLGGWEKELGRLEGDLDKALSFVRADRDTSERADMHAEVQRAIDLWITALLQSKCTVERRLLATESLCRLPPQACQEIVSVMLVNSVQAHARKILIETRNDQDIELNERVTVRNALCLEFSDNGVGLMTDEPEKIFHPTYSTKPEKFGTGLGLFIARELARRAGGDLRVKEEAERSRGVTFSLVLPIITRRE